MKKWNVMKKAVSLFLSALLVVSAVPLNDALVMNAHAEEKNTAESTINNAMKLWYASPANINTAESSGGEWMQQSLPLGNGNLGNLIFGGIAKERIHFNEKTLWTGGPSSSRPGYQFGNRDTAYSAAEIQEYRLILDDKSQNVFNDSMSGYGYVPIRFSGASNLYKGEYQDFGDIWLDFAAMGITNSNVSDYRRELDLQTGIASTTFTHDGVEYVREHFVSSPDNVMVTKVSASESGKLDVKIKMELNNGGLRGTTAFDTAANTCTIAGTVADNGLQFRTTMKVIPVGGTITANTSAQTYTVTDADSFMIIMAAETDYKNDYPTYRDTEKDLAAVVNGRVQAAAAKSYDELKENHLEDHQTLFDRVVLDLNEVVTDIPTNELMDKYRNGEYSKYLEILSFQFGRYLTIAGSRGTLPSNLVGLWTVGGSAWTGDYHFNVNVQMNYWPVYVTNLAECGTTMVEYMENLREPGRLTAERIHGIEGAVENHTGFVVHTENNPFGMTAPSNAQEYGWNPTGAAWAIQNLWAHYEFTQNEKYLRDMIYPIMKEAALFWDNYLWTSNYQVIDDETSPYDGQKRLVVAPSFSEEQGPTAIGTTYDQSLVWELYNECVQAAEILGVDEELAAQWKDKMLRLDPIEINATNGIKEWYEETRVGLKNGHNQSYAQAGNLAEIAVPNSGWWIGHPGEQRHASHLVGLYPGTLINKENEEYMSAAIQSLTERGVYSTGWSKANKINLWARTGNGDMAYTLLNNLIGGKASGLQYNLFDSHGSNGGETMMQGGSPVWQIDGNYGLTAGVAEMLIQSQLGYVQFLPAIPAAWGDGNVQGLKARGNFTIGQTWYNGAPDEFTVCYDGDEASSEFVGEYSEITDAKVTLDGKAVEVTKDEENGRISFEAVQGKTYVIDMSGTNTEKVKEYAESYLDEIHPDLIKAKEELQAAIENTDDNLNEILRKVKLMNEVYEKYPEETASIYYMTTEEGLTYKEIDSMYWQLRELKTALLANTEDLAYFEAATEQFESIIQLMKEQMSNREISFNVSGTSLTLNKDAAAETYVIRYTLDGSDPCAESVMYETAIPLADIESGIVKAALFLDEQRVSPVYVQAHTNEIKFDSAETTTPNWEGYGPEEMIDDDSETRWASLNPSGNIELIFSFDQATKLNGMTFEMYVSNKNYVDKYEIWALEGDEYQKIFTADKLLGEADATSLYFASKTIEFDSVTTTKIKVVFLEPYGEPTLRTVKPIMTAEAVTAEVDTAELEKLVADAEKVDREGTKYIEADSDLKKAFEESILDAKETVAATQAEVNSVEAFLRNRYLRILSGETPQPKEVKSIAVKTAPKTSYLAGESFAPEGLELELTYTDDSTETVVYTIETADEFGFVPEGVLTVEDKAVTITYGGKTTELEITVTENEGPSEDVEVIRLAGKDRYATSFELADEYKAVLGVDEFDAVIVATGEKAADALSGSYLAAQKEAPILLTSKDEVDDLVTYVKANLAEDGIVYILGGTGVVPAEVEEKLADYEVKRLKGADRYGTNLAILDEAGIKGSDILVATGEKEWDSLSASALNKPILLVNKELTADHEAVLEQLPEGGKIYILGGTGVVSADIETALAEFGTVKRVKGADRYATSVAIAEEFFGGGVEAVTMACGTKFPDGLCGGPLATVIGAPVLLVDEGYTESAAKYAADAASGYIFGGTGVVTDKTVRAVLGENITIVKLAD